MSDPLEYGTVLEVTQSTLGDELATDTPAGSTVLAVVDSVDFNEDGGQLQVGEEVLAYTTADLDEDQLTLAGPTTTAYLEGDPVQPWPLTLERTALVDLEDGGDPVSARVPHALWDRLPEGTRDPSEDPLRVSLGLDGSEWVVQDVLAREPTIDGSYIDPATVPDPTVPTTVPAYSPSLTVRGVTNGLVVQAEAVDVGTWITYHITDTPPLDPDGEPLPFTPTTATQFGDPTQATVLVITELPDGTALVADNTYYLRAVASNVVGTAAPGPQAEGELDLSTVSEVVSAQVTAGFLLAGSIQVGQITIDPNTGITIPTTDGGIELPADGGTATFSGAITTGSILVEDHLTINGEANAINGQLLLANVVEAPDAPPVVGWQFPSTTTIGADTWSLTESLDRTQWVSYEWYTDRVQVFRKSDGVRTLDKDIGNYYIKGITRGNDSYYFAVAKDRSAALDLVVLKLDANFNVTRSTRVVSDGSATKTAAVGMDHTTGLVMVAYSRNNGNDVIIRHYTTLDLTLDSSLNVVVNYEPSGFLSGTPLDMTGIHRMTTGPTGEAEWWVGLGGYLLRHSSTTPTADAEATIPEGVKGFHWDGTRLWSLGYNSYKTWKWSTSQWPAPVTATYTWHDSDVAGSGTHETPASPPASYQPPPFSYFRVKRPVPADAGDVDSPNEARIYLDNHLQSGGEPWAEYQIFDGVDTAGVPAPTVNSFENASSTPGRISSAAQDLVGPLIDLHGDGTARLPGLPPAGSIIMYAGASAPPGWLLCEGQAVSTALYPDLYAAIGFAFGGSGSTFNLPDLRGRFPFGASPGATTKGNRGDHETGTQGAAPGASDPARLDHRHSHTIPAESSSDGHSKAAGTTTPNVLALRAFDNHNHGGNTGNAGVASGNTQYHGFLTLNFIVKT